MMSFEEELFQKTKVDFSSLLPYGFHKEDGGYFYCKDFLRDEFSACIHIKDDGKIYGQVIEKAFNEEYITFRYKDAKGEFVTKIKEAYLAILNDIKKHCFIIETYRFPQTNRINNFIQESFHHLPIFKWDKEPYKDTASVFEDEINHKWYAIIMSISKKKLDQVTDVLIEVMNVKLDPHLIEEMIKTGKYYPAYHMNKKYWVSIPLDDTIQDEEIITYLTMSRNGIKNSNSK